jgi:nucleoid-associated protein YgaU
MGRMSNRSVITTTNDLTMELRDKKSISHYSTPKFKTLTESQLNTLQVFQHVWKEGDKYHKLSTQYYQDSSYWWVIARFNNKPTEAHLTIGDIVYIPVPFERIVSYYRD